MKFEFLADASDTPPTRPSNPSAGYPSNGDPAKNIPPTTPGAYFYYQLMVEFTTLLERAGITPDAENLHQLADWFDNYKASLVSGTAASQEIIAACNDYAGVS